MIDMADFTASTGKLTGKSGCTLILSSHSPMHLTACSVLMLLYIDYASAVKTKAYGGRSLIFLIQFSSWAVLLMGVGTKCYNF